MEQVEEKEWDRALELCHLHFHLSPHHQTAAVQLDPSANTRFHLQESTSTQHNLSASDKNHNTRLHCLLGELSLPCCAHRCSCLDYTYNLQWPHIDGAAMGLDLALEMDLVLEQEDWVWGLDRHQ